MAVLGVLGVGLDGAFGADIDMSVESRLPHAGSALVAYDDRGPCIGRSRSGGHFDKSAHLPQSRPRAPARALATKGAPRAGASVLEDASRASFKAADGPISISRKHLTGAGGRYNKFAEGVDVDGVVREALRSPNATFRPNPAGGYRVDTDLGRAIGQGGRTTLRSIVSPDGRVVTAFPYGPKTP